MEFLGRPTVICHTTMPPKKKKDKTNAAEAQSDESPTSPQKTRKKGGRKERAPEIPSTLR